MITEFHDMGYSYVMVIGLLAVQLVVLSHDARHYWDTLWLATCFTLYRQRGDVYWLSKEERLRGVIPCLEGGPHSFCTVS